MLADSTQDEYGNVYHDGQLIYRMTADGLVAANATDAPDEPTPAEDQEASHAAIGISPEQIAAIQSQLPDHHGICADGTIRDRHSGAIVATLAFTSDTTPDNATLAEIDIVPQSTQDELGNVYHRGQLVRHECGEVPDPLFQGFPC